MGLTAHALGAIASIVAVHASHSVLFADGSWTRYTATAVAACAVGVGGVLIPGPGGWIGPTVCRRVQHSHHDQLVVCDGAGDLTDRSAVAGCGLT